MRAPIRLLSICSVVGGCSGDPAVPLDPGALRLTDALLPAAWTVESGQVDAALGVSVASAGDVNGDGYADVVVGADGFSGGQAREGRATVYLGSAAGLSAVQVWAAQPDRAESEFGHSVASAGDVDGDGYDDVIVGAQLLEDGEYDEGRVYLYPGSAAGPAALPTWAVESDQKLAFFGGSVASAGDVNGDGFADVIVGAVGYDDGESAEGGAFVYHGSAAGLSVAADWQVESDQALAGLGFSVASAGDVNGDGFDDVVVGALAYDGGETSEGAAFLYLGSAAGLSAVAAWTVESDQAFGSLGISVAGAGDVNGDGYDDVVVGAIGYDDGETDEGAVFVFHGSPAGLSAAADWMVSSDLAYAYLGVSVASAGDVNGDGYADVVIGSERYAAGQVQEGGAWLYLGSPAGLSAASAWAAEGDRAGALFGSSVASAGDVDGDGLDDVLVGAPGYADGQAAEGRAYLFPGAPGDGDGDGAAADLDCDDADPGVFPGAPEAVADGVDQDCDGVDACHEDLDGDGHGGAAVVAGSSLDCAAGDGAPAADDCDDAAADVHPGAAEAIGDGVDGDCDATELCFADGDGDGWRTEATVTSADADCADAGEALAVTPAGDCDDADPAARPGAAEVVADAVDQDCDAVDSCFEDADGDDVGTAGVVVGSSLDCAAGEGAPFAGDNCPTDANPDQADADGDATGDACDACPADPADACADPDTDAPAEPHEPVSPDGSGKSGGCATAPGAPAGWLACALLALVRRPARARRPCPSARTGARPPAAASSPPPEPLRRSAPAARPPRAS